MFAIDGTKKYLPQSAELVEQFGVTEGTHFPQLLACALYDALAKIPCDIIWGPCRASERVLAKELCLDLGPEDLLLMDTGFPSFGHQSPVRQACQRTPRSRSTGTQAALFPARQSRCTQR